jgi:hypothetical protein
MSGSETGFLSGLRRWASRLALAGLIAGGLGAAVAATPAAAAAPVPGIVAPAADVLQAQYYGHRGPPPGYYRGRPPPRPYYGRPGYRPGYYGPPRGYRPPPPPPHWRHRGPPPPRYYRY